MKARKFFALVLVLVMLVGCMTISGYASVTIEPTVNNTAPEYHAPLFGYYVDTYTLSESIYPASYLGLESGAVIYSLTWYLSTPASKEWGCNWEIYFKEVEGTSPTANDLTNATKVYEGTIDGTGSTITLEFNALQGGYTYNGGNLAIFTKNTTLGSYSKAIFVGSSCASASAWDYEEDYIPTSFYKTIDFLPKVTFDCFYSLDTTTTSSKNFDANYTFTQASEEYTDVTKVKLEWTVSDISATYKSHKTWVPDLMKWVEAKEDIVAADQTATLNSPTIPQRKYLGQLNLKLIQPLLLLLHQPHLMITMVPPSIR